MTDCNPKPLAFSSLGPKARRRRFPRRPAHLRRRRPAAPRGRQRRLGLLDALDAAIPDPRDPGRITHDQRSMIAQRVVAIALGYEDLNDHHDPARRPRPPGGRRRLPDAETPLASPPTLCRLENRVDRAALIRISASLVDQFIASHATPAGAPDPRLRRHRRPGPRPPGGAVLPRLLRQLLLPAPLRLLRRRAAGRLPAARQHRRGQAQPRPPEAAGPAAPRRPGRRSGSRSGPTAGSAAGG